MGFFDGKNFDSSGKTPKSGGFFSSYNVPVSVTNKTIPNAREEAIARGEAVGSASRFEKTGKVAPSFFGGIVRDLIKPEAQIVKWAGDVGTTTPKSSYSEYLGTLSPNTGLQPETFGKDFKQVAGVGMQAGVNLAGVGFTSVGKTAVGGVIKKKVADVATKDLIKGLAKEGATYGAGSSLGSSLEKNDNLKNTLINTAKGTVAGAVLNTAIGLGVNTLRGNKVFVKGKERDFLAEAQTRAGVYKIPEAGTPPPGYFNKNITALPANDKYLLLSSGENTTQKAIRVGDGLPAISNEPIPLESSSVSAGKRKIAQVVNKTQQQQENKTPIQRYIESYNSKKDFVNSIVNAGKDVKEFFNSMLGVERTPTVKQLETMWENGHPGISIHKPEPLINQARIPKVQKTPKAQIAPTTPDLPIKTQEVAPSMAPQSPIINQVDSNVAGGIKQPIVENIAKIKQDTEHLIRDAGESVDNPLVYSTHEDWSRKVNSLPEDVQNSVAMGGKNPFPEVPAEAFKSIVAKRAEDMGDQNLIYKLSKDTSVKTASSKSAQELNAINMSNKDSTVRIVDRINTEIQQKLSPVMKEKINKESIDVTKKVLNDVKNAKPRKEIVDSVLSMLMCK